MSECAHNSKRCRQGGASVFAEVFLDCRAGLKSVISRYLRRPEDVEDIIQETFVRTYAAGQRSNILNVKAYFFRTAHNLSRKRQRAHANRLTDYLAALDMAEVCDERASVEAACEAGEQLALFCEALRQLPAQCRRVLILKKVYGLSHADIARHLNITVSTSNQHLAKGIARCTLYLHQHGYLDGLEHAGGGAHEQRVDGKAE